MSTEPPPPAGTALRFPPLDRREDRRAAVAGRLFLYLRGLRVKTPDSLDLVKSVLAETGDAADYPASFAALWRQLAGRGIGAGSPGDAAIPPSAPPLRRRGMTAGKLDYLFHRKNALCPGAAWRDPPDSKKPGASGKNSLRIWPGRGRKRRLVLALLTVVPALVATYASHRAMPPLESPLMRAFISALLGILCAWVAIGFWSACAGLILLLRHYDRFGFFHDPPDAPGLPDDARVAVLFPIYNEDIRAVAARVRTVAESLRETGEAGHFDLFLLSDSTNPDAWVAEEEAWRDLALAEGGAAAPDGFGAPGCRIFYRHRWSNRKGKSGNIADFCRRWGAAYSYMIVFDADSLMSGRTMLGMTRIMENHPDAGILQTAPKSIHSRSLIARMQQFSNHLYGPAYAAGLHFWQLGDAQYWGHNAIIRVEPFMRHCHLPELPGRAPLGGHILSHDFVEAALMRKAGYGVWLAYSLDGSYEENPPTLLDELARDRRWCQGNLQHARLVFARGFFPTQRALFINGIMSYGSAILWLAFLLASSIQAVTELLTVPSYFPAGPSLFPDWPKYFTNWTLVLFGGTLSLLLLPKLFIILAVTFRGQASGFGGTARLFVAAALETALSTLLAPVRMLFHSLFVAAALLGFTVGWTTQNRGGGGTSWGLAFRRHWWGTLLGLIWGGLMYVIDPGFFLWLSPIVLGLALSIPLSVWTSREGAGSWLLRRGIFLTPAEVRPGPELRLLEANLHLRSAGSGRRAAFGLGGGEGFKRAVVEPEILELHLGMRGGRGVVPAWKSRAVEAMLAKASATGPEGLGAGERRWILREREALLALHRQVWELEGPAAGRWGIRQT